MQTKWLPVWEQSFGEICLGPPSDHLAIAVRAWSSGRSVFAYSFALPASWIRSAATSKHTGTGATNKPMVSSPSKASAENADDQPREDAHAASSVPQPSHDGPDGDQRTNEWDGDDDDDLCAVDLNQGIRRRATVGGEREGGHEQSGPANDGRR